MKFFSISPNSCYLDPVSHPLIFCLPYNVCLPLSILPGTHLPSPLHSNACLITCDWNWIKFSLFYIRKRESTVSSSFTADFNSLWPHRFQSLFRISEVCNKLVQCDYVVASEVAIFRGEVGTFVANSETKFELSTVTTELFNPARKGYPQHWSEENCRPPTGRQRTNIIGNI